MSYDWTNDPETTAVIRALELSDASPVPDVPAIHAKDATTGLSYHDKLDEHGALKPEYGPFVSGLAELAAEIQKHGRDSVLFPALRGKAVA